MEVSIGIDIGGTKCALSVGECTTDSVRILHREEFPTKGLSWQEVLREFNNRIIELSNNRIEDVDFIYTHKTADLFIAAAAMGGLAGGGSEADVAALKEFALNLGLAFQYEDDLLDGDSPYPKEKTEELVRETTSAAIAALGRLPGDTSFLRELAQKLVGRKV